MKVYKNTVVAVQYLILLVCCFYDASCSVVISPFPRVAICNIGNRLEVLCKSTESSLSWNLTFIGINHHIERTITSDTIFQDIVVVNSTLFTFSRTSKRAILPLTSTMVINSVSRNLNGSNITCKESSSTLAPAMMTTTIFIIGDNNAYHPNQPEVSYEEQFEVDNVTVGLQWTEELNNSLHVASYHVSIEPMAHINIGNGKANITLSYNTPYNVSVVAIDFCGRRDSTTTLRLNYANCGDILDHVRIHDLIVTTGYTIPALEGATINFECPLGQVLSGSNVSICTMNGEWKPDPRQVECKANCGALSALAAGGYILPYSGTLEGTNVTYVCPGVQMLTATCTKAGYWEPNLSYVHCKEYAQLDPSSSLSVAGKIAVASASVTFFVTCTLAFTAGFLCCRLYRKQKQLARNSDSAPVYEEILPLPKGHNTIREELELTPNIVYCTVQSI